MVDISRLQVAIWSVKLALYSTGVIATAVFLKHAIPCFGSLALSTLPRLWTSLRSWLVPPYLYIVVNFIILTIAASSNFQHMRSQENVQAKAGQVLEKQKDSEVAAVERIPADPQEKEPEIFSGAGDSAPARRRRVRASASSKSLGAAEPKEPDTLDDTWRAITEGRGRRQLKKSDTWESAPRVEAGQEEKGLCRAAGGGGRDLNKWEAFKEEAGAAASASASWVGLPREISLSKEDLNRRAEAFIQKFNHEIRLQRQQSDEKSLELLVRK